MKKEKASIYDFARLCKVCDNCKICPIGAHTKGLEIACNSFVRNFPDKANEIILKWCKEHPVKTRQDKLLKMFPNTPKLPDGTLMLCPLRIDDTYKDCVGACEDCYKRYWLAEVDE